MGTVFVCHDVPVPADPTLCTAWTADEYQPDPWSISVSDAQLLASAILALWALAWVFRQVARILSNL